MHARPFAQVTGVTGAPCPARTAYSGGRKSTSVISGKPTAFSSGPEVAAVLLPLPFNDADLHVKHARASLLQQAPRETQERQARRAAGRV